MYVHIHIYQYLGNSVDFRVGLPMADTQNVHFGWAPAPEQHWIVGVSWEYVFDFNKFQHKPLSH